MAVRLNTGKMNSSKVTVAVRVRPIDQREEDLNSKCVVQVDGNQITLLSPSYHSDRKKAHIFTFDNCFLTKDRNDSGQDEVFKHLGDGFLDHIWKGYNSCVFAYVQTGSGKTFSMMGTNDHPGIIPRICSALFNRESNYANTIKTEVSYFEIYNEEVRDLLRSTKSPKKLKVREDKVLGPYVEELSSHAVQSHTKINLLLDQGNKLRVTAETQMNDRSSRSHAILTLTVTQTCNEQKSGVSRELVSKVSLVDLAGSERSSKSGAEGDQLKECSKINQSLTTLGIVINALAEIAENKRNSTFVNYRGSALTRLLKNNLGGNSKTIMLATVSPAADNYEETLSTLRYADSAKRIVNQAVVNEDVKSKAIEELQGEIRRLREELNEAEHEKVAQVEELKLQLKEKENLLRELQISWEEKLERTEAATLERQKNLEKMGITVNKQDVIFNKKLHLIQQDSSSLVIHDLNDITKIGSGPSQNIQIADDDEIEIEHCIISKRDEGEVFLSPVQNSTIYINGCLCTTETQLWHKDRILLGKNTNFTLHFPDRKKPAHWKKSVTSEAEAQTQDGLSKGNDILASIPPRTDWMKDEKLNFELKQTSSNLHIHAHNKMTELSHQETDAVRNTQDCFHREGISQNSVSLKNSGIPLNSSDSTCWLTSPRSPDDQEMEIMSEEGEQVSQREIDSINPTSAEQNITGDLETAATSAPSPEDQKMEIMSEEGEQVSQREIDSINPTSADHNITGDPGSAVASVPSPKDQKIISREGEQELQRETDNINPSFADQNINRDLEPAATSAPAPEKQRDGILPPGQDAEVAEREDEINDNTIPTSEIPESLEVPAPGAASEQAPEKQRDGILPPGQDAEVAEREDEINDNTIPTSEIPESLEVPAPGAASEQAPEKQRDGILPPGQDAEVAEREDEINDNTIPTSEIPESLEVPAPGAASEQASYLEFSATIHQSKKEIADTIQKSFWGWLNELRLSDIITEEEYNTFQETREEEIMVERLLTRLTEKDEATCKAFLKIVRRHQDKRFLYNELLEKMEIDVHKLSKLSLQNVLEISPEYLMEGDSSTDNALWHFIRTLMSLNGEARNINKFLMKEEESVKAKQSGSFMLLCEVELRNEIHPLDVVCAAFHWSDHFLQQEIASKMAMCQFAIPLLLPAVDGPEYTFMLWTMRGIVKRWRPQSLADRKGFQENNLVNVPMSTVSFSRLGSCRLSKSKILNQLLGSTQRRHDIFVHRDMESGNAPRRISDGLVEISWYFPAGKGNFPEPVAFTNLRGELESNLKQFSFLSEISSVIAICMNAIDKDRYELLLKYNNASLKYLLIIMPEDNKTMEETQRNLNLLAPKLHLSQENVLLITKGTNETAAVSKIYSSLLLLFQNSSNNLSLQEMTEHASKLLIRLDEDSEACQAAQNKAKEIIDEIDDVVKYKRETMKLQACPLRELAKLEKEMCQMKLQGNTNGEKYKSNLREQCKAIRQEQWDQEVPEGISSFVNAIRGKNKAEKFYFLQWLKFYLDLKGRQYLHPLQDEYKEKCNLPNNQKQLAELDQEMCDSSLGIEHFLREVGQFYEAWHSMGKRNKSSSIQFECLPEIAADLLLDGFPLELIDGDASRIPLQWIKDILTQVNKKTKGMSKLKVITVLGVQSTGKSTLLNTMFGLQFPVSSGRCTRGAFMTLLKVREDLQKKIGCHFILVIDTEGLKAPELDFLDGSYEHDNELATLVIGLSDITIINMAMENTTEMKDILQIVIHAFLRMKEIGKKPNCQFIHQNVSDVSAPVMNMRGRKKLVDQLDEMTRTVAVMEKKTQFRTFSDIMDYDLEHHNSYIPGLWHGLPPMASVSSAYSESITELKHKLLKSMREKQNDMQRRTHNITEFIEWVSNLWNAVKHENFIFSFRNSLIAKAYNELSMKYSEHEGKFSKLIHEWFTKSETLIKNQSAETLEAKVNECRKDAHVILNRGEKRILDWLEEYFNKGTDCAQLIKYKSDFMISAQNLRKNLETSSTNKLNEAIQIQKGKIKIKQLYSQHTGKIEKKVSILIDEYRKNKCQLKGAELEIEFENIWKDTIKDLQEKPLETRDIEGEMMLVLTKDMKEKGSGVNEKLQQIKHFTKPKEQKKFSLIGKVKNFWEKITNWKENFQYEDFFSHVLETCTKFSKKWAQKDADYDDTYCIEILKIIDVKCQNEKVKYYFPAENVLDLKLRILGYILEDFQKMHLNFVKKNDPYHQLGLLKPVYFKTFTDAVTTKNASQDLAKRICEDFLKSSITDHMNRKLGIEVVDDIANSKGSEKYTSRMFFQFTVLKSLLEEDDYQQYAEYSNDYEHFVKSFIENYIIKEYKNIGTLQEKILSDITGCIQSFLKTPEDLNSPDVSWFLSHLCEKLSSDLVLPQEKMKAIIFENSANLRDFIDYMKYSLHDTVQEIQSEIKTQSTEYVLSCLTLKPQDELFKKVFGCGKQCPFCKAPCEAGGTDHKEHFASVHRPEGLGSYRWIKTGILCHDICSTLVVGNATFKNEKTNETYHPYKNYRDYYPDWKIQPDSSIEASDYWKFVLKEYNQQFAAEYDANPAKYPDEWNNLTREMAMESLQKNFNM
ncbi:interferon-induced very large GTPase 1-like [Hyperolius riggenbachi]|uniref:interferon-induced very large GTPase 1-like n=1 Tax=Hyperolius riggenbachi TaxID=752182 RepID=UPI0035A3B39C